MSRGWKFDKAPKDISHRHKLPRTWFKRSGSMATCLGCGERYMLCKSEDHIGSWKWWQYKDKLK